MKNKSPHPQKTQKPDKMEHSLSHAYSYEDERGFVYYSYQDLTNDRTYKKLKANESHIYEKPSLCAKKVSVIENAWGTRFFRRYRKDTSPALSYRDDIQRDQSTHTLHINYYLEALEKSRRLTTAVDFVKGKPPRRKKLESIYGYKWNKEFPVREFSIIPDIIGFHSASIPDIKLQFQRTNQSKIFQDFYKASPSPVPNAYLDHAVLVEVVNQGPPTKEKWNSLTQLTIQHNALVIFVLVTDIDPSKHNGYFTIRSGNEISCAFFMYGGQVFKNGKEKPPRYNYESFKHEVKRLQKNNGYKPSYNIL